MLTVLRYLLLIVTATLDHFCPEFCLPHNDRVAQGTDMAAVSAHRPLDGDTKDGDTKKSELRESAKRPWRQHGG
jgi:hypothetical protein